VPAHVLLAPALVLLAHVADQDLRLFMLIADQLPKGFAT
jgi:hypothetical protein